MIACIQGKVAATHKDHLIVMVGGMGFQVFAPYSTLERVKSDEVFLYTTLVVREDSLTLYGFMTAVEKELFDILLRISGIGPRLALAILSTLSIDSLRNAVVSDRSEVLARVPGIGKKTAQKIVLELKDKLAVGLEAIPGDVGISDVNTDVMDALVALGYSIVEAQMAIQALPSDAPDDIEERVRMALQYFI